MKTLTNILKYIAILLMTIVTVSLITSCKKDGEKDKEELGFNINRAEDYYIFATYVDDRSSVASGTLRPALFDFQTGKSVSRQRFTKNTYTYEITENNTVISFSGIKIMVNNGNIIGITEEHMTYSNITVIKKSDVTGTLAGRTFKGTYYKHDGSVVWQNCTYIFADENNRVGFLSGSAERVENYTPIGNIGALVEKVSDTANDGELLLLIKGKLDVYYLNRSTDPQQYYHGSFTEQK